MGHPLAHPVVHEMPHPVGHLVGYLRVAFDAKNGYNTSNNTVQPFAQKRHCAQFVKHEGDPMWKTTQTNRKHTALTMHHPPNHQRRKRWLSLTLILMLILTMMPMPFAQKAQAAQGPQKLIVHYQRTAKDYDGWDLWLWEDGKEGKAIAFTGEDDYGKIWTIDSLNAAKYGFIVRKGNWESKDIGTDRFVDLVALNKDGITEIWLKQDQAEIITSPDPSITGTTASGIASATNSARQPAPGSLELIVHYRRFDNNYDNWNLWVWPKTKEGKSYTFTKQDDFGKVAQIPLESLENITEIGIIVRKGEWEQKDTDQDRFIPVSKVGADGKLHVYIVQGTETLYYNLKDIDLSPRFMKAGLIDEKAVKLTTSMPIKKADLRASFSIKSTTGHTLTPAGVSASGDIASEFVITFKEAVKIGQTYTTSYKAYKPLILDQAGLYDTQAFEAAYGYQGPLGAIYTQQKTDFYVWSPIAAAMTLKLYHEGHGGFAYETLPMTKGEKGVWQVSRTGDLSGKYYTFTITYPSANTGTETNAQAPLTKETYDPYALSAGVNGDRSMITDLKSLRPQDYGVGKLPSYKKANDLLVYEMHIRDLTNHESSGATQKGKYLGVIEAGTQFQGAATGLDHIKALGVTHVQILPMYDFNSIDESRLEDNVFNWGYDPKNYSVPEGSYATNPYDGRVRVKELGQMVEGLHQAGIGVIMDVVYNHTALSADSNLDILVPGYYYRMVDGKFSNGSGTGNETASERYMVRRLMIDSLKHWVSHYNIDGFRFDLMGVHDTETMRQIEKELRALKPDIILYGEGWTGGTTALPEAKRLVKKNMYQVPGIGAFNDDFRDAIKGHVFEAEAKGFIAGALGFIESLKFGFVGAGDHPQINYGAINYSKKAWTQNPSQAVNYVSAHDNLTLWDKIAVTAPEATSDQRVNMHKLANAMVLTSQGMPFLHAGVEMQRTKDGDHNSYKSPDAINNINWQWKIDNQATLTYYQGLIALRKAYPQLRLATQEAVATQLHFFDSSPESWLKLPETETLMGFRLLGNPRPGEDSGEATAVDGAATTEDKATEDLVLLFNGSPDPQTITLPKGTYQVLVNATQAGDQGIETLKGGEVVIPGISALVLSTGGKASTMATGPEGLVVGAGVGTILVALLGLLIAVGAMLYLRQHHLRKKS